MERQWRSLTLQTSNHGYPPNRRFLLPDDVHWPAVVRFVVGAGAWDGVWQHSVLHVPVAPVQVPPLTSTIP